MKRLLFVVLLVTAAMAAPGRDVKGVKILQRLKRQCSTDADGNHMCAVETCRSRPVLPRNGKLSCVIGRCNVACDDGYRFSNGAKEITLVCEDKQWVLENSQRQTVLPRCVRKNSG